MKCSVKHLDSELFALCIFRLVLFPCYIDYGYLHSLRSGERNIFQRSFQKEHFFFCEFSFRNFLHLLFQVLDFNESIFELFLVFSLTKVSLTNPFQDLHSIYLFSFSSEQDCLSLIPLIFKTFTNVSSYFIDILDFNKGNIDIYIFHILFRVSL